MEGYSRINLWFIFLVTAPLAEAITTVYLSQACNTSDVGIKFGDSLRLEPTSALTYYGRTSCYFNVEAPSGKLLLLAIRKNRITTVDYTLSRFRPICDPSRQRDFLGNPYNIYTLINVSRGHHVFSVHQIEFSMEEPEVVMFDLEQMINGVCVDYINIHDGGDFSAATLNPSPLCDNLPNLPNRTYLSTGNEMTIYFSTDDGGEGKGFEFVITPVSTGVCSSSEITCVNTSACVDTSLRCNAIDECGDNTDEAGCKYAELQDIRLNSNYGLIIGLIFGLLGFLGVTAALSYVLWHHFRWRLYVKKPMTAKMELEPTTYETAYPVTKLYYKEKYHTLYEDPVRKKSQIAGENVESLNGTESIDTEQI